MIGFGDLWVITNYWGNDLTLPKRRSVVDGRNTNLIVCVLDNDGDKPIAFGDHIRHLLDHIHIFAAKRQGIDASIGEDDELNKVDRVRTFTEDAALGSTLTTILQKSFYILKIDHI